MELLRKKLATVVTIFLENRMKNAEFSFFGVGFGLPEGEQVVVTIERKPLGVLCEPDSRL